jgi:SPW repeat
MDTAYHPHRGQVQTASGLNLLVGIWLIISSFVLSDRSPMMTNNVVFGVIVAILAALRTFGAFDQSWMSWVNAIIGAWVVISPWAIMGNTVTGPTSAMIVCNVITGAAILPLGIWSAVATNTELSTATYRGPTSTPLNR